METRPSVVCRIVDGAATYRCSCTGTGIAQNKVSESLLL